MFVTQLTDCLYLSNEKLTLTHNGFPISPIDDSTLLVSFCISNGTQENLIKFFDRHVEQNVWRLHYKEKSLNQNLNGGEGKIRTLRGSNLK